MYPYYSHKQHFCDLYIILICYLYQKAFLSIRSIDGTYDMIQGLRVMQASKFIEQCPATHVYTPLS